ncbi:MAG: helix-hairpin-helix domain-containing protein [Bacteroidales bacterium]|jgi:competence protein ComEA|nr:helix-hairpin-helix domain-containing protein [Bacteroidales bacterium]
MIKNRFREYFTFTKKERNGLIVLLLILFVLILIKVYQSNKSYGEIVIIDDDFRNDIEEFEKSLIPKPSFEKKDKTYTYDSKSVKNNKWLEPEVLFNFDPNKVSKNKMKNLGFSRKQINTLANYREKGGVFYKNEDLLKIYGIEKEQFEILDPYITIELKNKQEDIIKINEVAELIELNTASKENLIKLNGIGDAFAERIIKYRDLLGGYYKKEQVLEVYGMDSTRYFGFYQDIIIDTNNIYKLNLNDADFKILVRHPYLNKYQTKAILKYRELEGSFTKIEQIHQNKLLLKEEFLKLKPYLQLK